MVKPNKIRRGIGLSFLNHTTDADKKTAAYAAVFFWSSAGLLVFVFLHALYILAIEMISHHETSTHYPNY
jgi:hypothetical protein